MMTRDRLLALAALLLIGLALRLPPLAMIAAVLLLTAAVAQLWQRFGLRRTSVTQQLSQRRAFPDDTIELTVDVTNRKPLPLSSLTVRQLVSEGLDWGSDRPVRGGIPGRRQLERTTALGWYSAVRWRYQIRCPQRGVYTFGPVELETGDPFGFATQRQELAVREELVVYPALLPLADLGMVNRRPTGAARASHQLLLDPARPAGVRPYTPGDTPRSVHWRASARLGALQTKIYEPSANATVLIVLVVNTFQHAWQGVEPELLERLISTAATLAHLGLAQHASVGLVANVPGPDGAAVLRVAPDSAPTQRPHIFELLARLNPAMSLSAAAVLRSEVRRAPWGTTIKVVSALAPEDLRAAVAAVRAAGRLVDWHYLGAEQLTAPNGVRLLTYAPEEAR